MSVDMLSLENGLRSITTITSWDEFLRILLSSLGYPPASYERLKGTTPEEGTDIHGRIYCIFDSKFQWERMAECGFNRRSSRCRFLIILTERNIYIEDRQLHRRMECEKSCAYKCAEILHPLIGITFDAVSHKENATLAIAALFAELYHDILEANPPDKKAAIDNQFVRILDLCFLDGEQLLGDFKVSEYLRKYAGNDCGKASKAIWQLFRTLAYGYDTRFPAMLEKLVSPRDTYFDVGEDAISFSKRAYECVLDIFSKDWENVDISILGGIVQSVVEPKNNGYRQVLPPNEYTYKLIGPLFLDEFYEELTTCNGNIPLLEELSAKIRNTKVFDPSCSFGAILTSSYEKLAEIIEKIDALTGKAREGLPLPADNIYGIDASRFSLDVARVSFRWLFYQKAKGSRSHRYKIAQEGLERIHLMHGRPPRLNWAEFCPPSKDVFVVSNPPYVGARKQSSDDKEDMKIALGSHCKKTGDLDLATCWLFLGGVYLSKGAGGCSFMTTNSLVQGVHAGAFWPELLSLGCKISFAYTPFKLRPVISKNAPAVTVVVFGLSPKTHRREAELITDTKVSHPGEISPYLLPGHTVVYKTKTPISTCLPKMNKGNMPYDGGHLMIEDSDALEEIINEDRAAINFVRKVVGSEEFINEVPRWCIWVRDYEVERAMSVKPIAKRIEECRQNRISKSDPGAKRLAETPWRFREQRETTTSSLVVPSVSSERRDYIPIGFVSADTIVTNLSFVIYDCEPWLFGLIASRLHNLWIRTVCGGLETRLRYSSELGYNTFPVPTIDSATKVKLSELTRNILLARGSVPDLTLGQMYDNMPNELRLAHRELDAFVDRWYKPEGFNSDEERISYLMDLYETRRRT